MNFSTFDLNLLRVFDALMREQNVSRAAERLALSQPAVSNALNRLRELLDDPLLVRVGRSMQPTPRAQALETPIRAALQQLEQSLSAGDVFDPASSRQHFSIAVTDYVELICMPRLLEQLSQQAPGMRIDIRHLSPSLPAEALDKGELDLVLGRFEDIPARFARQHWMSETLQLALRRDHPLGNQPMDLRPFCSCATCGYTAVRRVAWSTNGWANRACAGRFATPRPITCRPRISSPAVNWLPCCRPSWRATLPACCRCNCSSCRSPSARFTWKSSAWPSANVTRRCIG